MDSLIYFIRGPATTMQASLRDWAYSRGGVEREWEECKVHMREGGREKRGVVVASKRRG